MKRHAHDCLVHPALESALSYAVPSGTCITYSDSIAQLQAGSIAFLPLGTAWQGTSRKKEVRLYPLGIEMVY